MSGSPVHGRSVLRRARPVRWAIALILGAFTGIAAFFGALMNWNFMMAGSASSNPLLFVLALGLVMAWKIAGYIGLDYFLLPLIGTPWGWVTKSKQRPAAEKA